MSKPLNAMDPGGQNDAAKLLPLVYDELRRLAAKRLAEEPSGNTLQPTALVHEAYLRLVNNGKGEQWNHRGHFYCAAAIAMERILVESARRRQTLKRGGGRNRQRLDDLGFNTALLAEDLLALEEALSRFTVVEPIKANLVKLRYFSGLTIKEAADVLEISVATATRHWTYARAWLFGEISGERERFVAPSS